MAKNSRPIWKKLLRFTGWLLGILLSLLVVLLLLLQTPWAQNQIRLQANTYLQKTLKTNCGVNKLYIDWLFRIQMEDLYVNEPDSNDTLFRCQHFSVDYKLLDLLQQKVTISAVELDGLLVRIKEDSVSKKFNFSFIPEAFADTTEENTSAPSASKWTFQLGKIKLSNYQISFETPSSGMQLSAQAQLFETNLKSLDPDFKKIHLSYVLSEGLQSKLILKETIDSSNASTDIHSSSSLSSVDKDENQDDFSLEIDRIDWRKTSFTLKQESALMDLQTFVWLLQVNKVNFQLSAQQQNPLLSIGELLIQQHTTRIETFTAENNNNTTAKKPEELPEFPIVPIQLYVGKTILEDHAFLWQENKKMLGKVDDFSLLAGPIASSNQGYALQLVKTSLLLNDQIPLQNLAGNLFLSRTQAYWKNALVQTNKNQLAGNFQVNYADWPSLLQHPEKSTLNVQVSKAQFELGEWMGLFPEWRKNEQIQRLQSKVLTLKTTVKGTLSDLRILQLELGLAAANKTPLVKLKMRGQLKQLTDLSKASGMLEVQECSGQTEPFLELLPKNTFAAYSSQLPKRFVVSGKISGAAKDFNSNLLLQTDLGKLSLKANGKNILDSLKSQFQIHTQWENIALGTLLKNKEIGEVTGQLTINGNGYTLEQGDIQYNLELGRWSYGGKSFNPIEVSGQLQEGILMGNLNLEDSLADLQLDYRYGIGQEKKSLFADFQVNRFNAAQFGWSAWTGIKTRVLVDMERLSTQNPEGRITIKETQIAKSGELFVIDSVLVESLSRTTEMVTRIQSAFLTGEIKGNYTLDGLPKAVQRMYQQVWNNAAAPEEVPEEQAEWSVEFRHRPWMQQFLPDFYGMTPLQMKGNVNAKRNQFGFTGQLGQVYYGEFLLDSLKTEVELNEDSLAYGISINRLSHPDYPLYRTEITGGATRGILRWKVATNGKKEEPRYRLGGLVLDPSLNADRLDDRIEVFLQNLSGLKSLRNSTVVHLNEDILLNGEPWQINKDNAVVLQEGALVGGKLNLSRNGGKIEIQTAPGGVPVSLVLEEFPLSAVSALVEKDTLLVEGSLTGKVNIPSISPFRFTGGFSINDLKSLGIDIGNLTAEVEGTGDQKYEGRMVLNGKGNEVLLNALYTTGEEENLQAEVKLNPLNLTSIEPIVGEYLSGLKGSLSGNLSIQGKLDQPKIRGILTTDSAQLVYKDYNTWLMMPSEKISFEANGIRLDRFQIVDSLGNKANIQGMIRTQNYQDFTFDLRLRANDFLAVNKQATIDQWIYGPAKVDADLTIRGNQNLPEIEGKVKVVDGSELTVVIKEENPGIESREGIVKFVNKNNPLDSSLLFTLKGKTGSRPTKDNKMRNDPSKNSSDTTGAIQGISVSVDAEMSAASKLTIILDEMNGDYLQVAGNASINTTIDPSGKISMTGRYTVESGKYQLSFNQLIKRSFNIQKGGTIIWNGDPTSATLDLSAKYNVNTNAYTLIKDVVSANNTAASRQKLPFEVYLLIKEELLKPEISFRLDMPERERNAFEGTVYTRLKQINQDPSELNKQVMGLLVLNNFIADNPFGSLESSLSGNLESTVRTTAGKLLGQQLNNLLGDVIKGVDLNFDLASRDDFSSGDRNTQTDLNIGVSKNLFNDRTTVTIGSSIGLEGDQNATNLAGDVTIEYKITKDGRYRVKLYRVNNDEAILRGQVIETGVSFILFMDYNSFKELLEKAKQKEEQEEGQKKKSRKEKTPKNKTDKKESTNE